MKCSRPTLWMIGGFYGRFYLYSIDIGDVFWLWFSDYGSDISDNRIPPDTTQRSLFCRTLLFWTTYTFGLTKIEITEGEKKYPLIPHRILYYVAWLLQLQPKDGTWIDPSSIVKYISFYYIRNWWLLSRIFRIPLDYYFPESSLLWK